MYVMYVKCLVCYEVIGIKSKTEKNCDWGQHIEFDDDCDKTSLFIMVWTQASKCKMKLL